MRFVFIMLVVMSHIIGKSFDFGGESGVSFFFILSGFILSYAYGKKVAEGTFGTKAFIKKQLTKFYPLHLLTFFIMVALDARLERYFEWYRLLPNMLLLQSWIPDDSFFFVANGSSWFLSDLLFFYLVFSLAFSLLTRLSVRRLILVLIIVLAAYVALALAIPMEKVNAVLYANPATRLIDFCIGILLYRYTQSNIGKMEMRWIAARSATMRTAIEICTVLLVVGSFFVYEYSPLGFRCASLFWFVSPVVLFVFVSTDNNGGLVARLLHHPIALWLGSISMEIYLTHWITMRIFYSLLLPHGIGEAERLLPWMICATIGVIILVSYATKRWFVNPIHTTLQEKLR